MSCRGDVAEPPEENPVIFGASSGHLIEEQAGCLHPVGLQREIIPVDKNQILI